MIHNLEALEYMSGHPLGAWEAVCSCYDTDGETQTGWRSGEQPEPLAASRAWLDHQAERAVSMNDPYTPTTKQVRSVYVIDGTRLTQGLRGPDFDRWLAEVRAEAKAEGAVEQRERDAHIAEEFDWQSWSEPNRVIAAAIREQGTTDKHLPIDPNPYRSSLNPDMRSPTSSGACTPSDPHDSIRS